MKPNGRQLLALMVTVLLGGIRLFAQAASGTIVGTVSDSSGAVVGGATVVVTNVKTQVSSTWQTNESGEYTAPFLIPGTYQVSVEHSGFKKAVRTDIPLQVADKVRADVTLELGAVSETVTATADAPLVKTDTSELGQVIQNRPIEELPLNSSTGRNFTALMALVPGTIRTNPVGVFDAPQGNSSFVVNGTRDSANNYMIDGADNNESLLGIVAILPPPEALAEFNLQTNTFSAEYGRAGGAVINVQTKSGTNSLHGSVYEFLRNDALDARGPFSGAKLPPLRQNEFGATLGGPIIKNKTFLFGDYVGFRQRAGQTYTTTVPTLAQRQGTYLTAEGAGVIYDPLTKAPFPNNTIPAARINPAAQKIISLYPMPNRPGTVSSNSTGVSNNYAADVVQQQDSTRGDLRLDHTFSQKNSLFGRYSIFDAYTALPPLFGEIAAGSTPSRAGKGDSRDQNVVIGDVHSFAPDKINEFRIAFTRIANSFTGWDYGRNTADEFGIPNLNIFGAISSGLPNINIEGLATSLGTDAPIPALRYEQNWQFVDNFTILTGKHTIKFGADYRRFRGDFFQISLESPRGRFDFDRNFTSDAGRTGTGLGLASFLLGYPSLERRGVIYDFPSNISSQFFAFIQDDIKVTQRLVVNIGLRYELYPATVDRYDNQSNFDMRTGQVLLAGRGKNSRSLVDTDFNNWAPRFGFAYRMRDKTVVRGGYGISYFPDKFGATGGTLNTNYPFITVQEIVNPDRYTPLADRTISNGIPVPARPNLSSETVPLVGSMTALDPNYSVGYFQFWNFGIQQQLGSQYVLEAAYVGTKGTHLFGNVHVDINRPDPGPGAIDPRRPYYSVAPLATSVRLRDSSQSSIYHSLQVKVQKRLSEGLFFLNSYTWSKGIDDAGTKTNLRDWRGTTRGPMNTDYRHGWITSALYELPFGRGRRFAATMPLALDAVLGGWQTNGIYTFRTGLPSTVSLSAGLVSSIQNDSGSGRPDQIAPAELPKDERSLLRYFNTAAFVARAANSYQFGNAGRNTVRGPSFSNLDFSLFKNFRYAERFNFQVRAESFNMLNHPNFSNPSTAFGTAAFGTITSTTSNNRQIQFGLKLLF